MKHFSLLIIGIFSVFTSSFLGLVVTSQNQIGALEPTTESLELNDDGALVMIEGDPLFPQKLSGLASQGQLEYIKLGCVNCHSQQIRRASISRDLERELGFRFSVPRDYIYQKNVLLGSQRIGPDLSNVGLRDFDKNWHYLHLYNPQITSPGSVMAPFSYLFEEIEGELSEYPNALIFPEGSPYAPDEGYVIIPTRRSSGLVEYLLSLKFEYNLPEAIISNNEQAK